jgi:autotransporter-associated beta strand protein
MPITSRTLQRLLLALLLSGTCSARAASITWGPATTIAGDTDVSTGGTLKYAYYWSSSTGNQTVNGVTFTRSGSVNAGTDVSLAIPNGATLGSFAGTAAPFTGLSTAYRGVVGGVIYNGAPYSGTITVTLKNLTVGNTYAVQVWLDDSRGSTDARSGTLTSSGGNSVSLRYNLQNANGGVGQYAVGTFTADATTQTFTSTSSIHAIFNALQVRDIGTTAAPVFTPNAGTYLGPQAVTISSEAGATIFYTTNGTTPSTSSPSGSSPVTVNISVPTTMTIQAFATNSAKANSATNTAVYTTVAAGSGVWTSLAGGSWTTNTANWTNSLVAAGTGSTADFTTLTLTANTTVTLDNPWTIGNMYFDDQNPTKNGWILNAGTGGALTLAVASGTPVISNNAPTAISAVLAGTQGLTKTGNGTLTLTGAESYTGATTISGGTLQIGNGGSSGSLSSATIVDNGSLVYSYGTGVTPTVPAINGTGSVSFTSGRLYFGGNNVTTGGSQSYTALDSGFYIGAQVAASTTLTTTNGGAISLTGDFGKTASLGNTLGLDTSAGNGNINLNVSIGRGGVWYPLSALTANAGTGTITVSGGNGANGWNSTSASLTGAINIAGNVAINCPAGVTLTTTGPSAVTGSFSGTSSLIKSGASTLTLSSASTYTGTTSVAAGRLEVNGSLAAGSAVTVQSGGALAGVGTINGPVTLNGGATLTPGTNMVVGALTLASNLTLNAASTNFARINYDATTTTADAVSMTGSSGIAYAGTLVVVSNASSAPFVAGNKFTLFTKVAGTFSGSFGNLVLPTLPFWLTWDASGLTNDGSISVVAASATAVPTFAPPGGGYVGAQSVAINCATPSSTILYTTDGSTPTLLNSTVYSGPIAVPVNSTMTLKAYATNAFLPDSAVVTATYGTVVTPTWTSAAGGSWTNTANWLNTVVASGLGVTADFSSLDLTADTTVTLDGAQTAANLLFGDATPDHNWTINPGSGGSLTLAASGSPVVAVINQTTTIGAAVAGTQGMTKAGAGTLALTGANTYTGPTTNSAGTLRVTDLTSYRSSTVIASGATFEANVAANVNATNSLNFTGNGTLLKTGLGTWLVGNVGRVGISLSPGGLVDIREGTIQSGSHAESWTGNQASVNIATGATVDLPAENLWADALTGGGSIIMTYAGSGGRTVYVGVTNGSGSFGGSIGSGSLLALNKSGTGTQILAGTNTYTGATTIAGGTLLIQGALANSPVTVQTNATLGGFGTLAGPVIVQNGGTLAPGPSIGTLTISNTLNLAAGSQVALEIKSVSGTQTCDQIAGATSVTVAGTLTVTLDGSSDPLAGGESFTFFNVAPSGIFSATNLPTLASGLNWFTPDNFRTLAVNRAPTASDFAMGVPQGEAATVLVIGGKYAPTDPDAGDTANLLVTAVALTTPLNGGTVAIVAGGASVTYTASATFNGTDSFTYTVSDGRGGSVTRTVTVNVAAAGSGPNIVGLSGTAPSITVNAQGIPGALYSLQYTDSLSPVSWQDAGVTNTATGTGVISLLDSAAPVGTRFYRTKYLSGP